MLEYRIETFLTLFKEMNYRRTAEILNMTQPGVTQHIQFLEKHYGVRLFVYDGKQLTRTEHAEALKRHIDSVHTRERTLWEGFSRRAGIHLEVGATKTIGEFVLPPVLEDFLSRQDNSIQFIIDNTENLLKLLEDSRLDFAVIEGIFDKRRYGYHLYKKEDYVGICAKNHPFAGRTVPLSEAFRQTLVIREPGSGTRRLLEQAICDAGFSLDCFHRCISISNFSVITDLVARGDAVTFGYAPVVGRREDLCTFRVEDIHITGEFNFVYCDEETARRKIELFFGS
jgi:DNA-binding transcriptional LysR family regulator